MAVNRIGPISLKKMVLCTVMNKFITSFKILQSYTLTKCIAVVCVKNIS